MLITDTDADLKMRDITECGRAGRECDRLTSLSNSSSLVAIKLIGENELLTCVLYHDCHVCQGVINVATCSKQQPRDNSNMASRLYLAQMMDRKKFDAQPSGDDVVVVEYGNARGGQPNDAGTRG
jgi:hypothetical protein